jgi:hypothetical protein
LHDDNGLVPIIWRVRPRCVALRMMRGRRRWVAVAIAIGRHGRLAVVLRVLGVARVTHGRVGHHDVRGWRWRHGHRVAVAARASSAVRGAGAVAGRWWHWRRRSRVFTREVTAIAAGLLGRERVGACRRKGMMVGIVREAARN